jgi:exo-beta-1,3-glucanase (GH17 family)
MRFSSVVSVALAAAPAVVSAARGSEGFALGTKKSDGSCKTQKDYEDDFDALSANTGAKLVRGYAASDCDFAKNILPAAKAKSFKVMLGIWYGIGTTSSTWYISNKLLGPMSKNPTPRTLQPSKPKPENTQTKSMP